ncbi:Holliday junction DNA helicase RuvA [Actinomycetales bacterium JB111]|nr:Holliday junction DNA helicase RuvA [Actinomycetales bacterium JB111]
MQASPSTLATLRHGQEATIATSLVVREDSLTLFGFADADERDIFETMQTVSGVGPRLALAITAVLSPDQLRRAVAEDDLTALQRVPGIGKKSAQRIVLEIGDRLGAPAGDDDQAAGDAAPSTSGPHPEVLAALVGLGWPEGQATAAIEQVSESGSAPAADDVPGLLRAALSRLGGGRRG